MKRTKLSVAVASVAALGGYSNTPKASPSGAHRIGPVDENDNEIKLEAGNKTERRLMNSLVKFSSSASKN